MVTCFSASPHEELEPLCHRLGLVTYFDALSGAGQVLTKADRLQTFSKKNWIGSRVYSVGDSYADAELAQALGFEFVAYTEFHLNGEDWCREYPNVDSPSALDRLFSSKYLSAALSDE